MRRSSISIAACAVAATVLAVQAAETPSPADAVTVSSLYVTGSDIATPQETLLLLHASPGSDRILARVGPRTVFGSRTRLAVVSKSGEWMAVISEALGNSVRGFIYQPKVWVSHDPFSLEVDSSARQLTVWRMGIRLRRFAVAVGAPGTPTPRGRFSITDKLRDFLPSLYGCCTLALSGRQTRLAPGWTGGNRLAIHAGSGIGRAISNGCLRASTANMRYLMRLLPVGTQVIVHA